MKKIVAILVVATMLCSILAMTPVLNAATADTVINSAEGTAVIDGVKDDAYANAVELVMDQCGSSNGGGAVLDTPAAHCYVINDAEWVYVFYDVHDTDLDNTSANYYEQDSIELFYMDGNVKQQWRIHYDLDNADPDMTKVPTDQYAVVVSDTGYTVEAKIPITDVKDNQIEMLVQVDWCSGGKRDATVYITGHPEGDDGWQRDNRQTNYDCWWTLQLVGEFEDTRVDPVEEPAELTVKNYAAFKNETGVYAQLYTQNTYDWSGWASIGNGENLSLGGTIAPEGWQNMFAPVASYTEEQIPGWSNLPIFAIQVGDSSYLKLPDNADVGTTGDSARYKFSYTDITVKANGYDDVVIPGGELSGKWLIKQESGYTSGTSFTIDLIGPAKDQLGLDIEGACTWFANVTDVVTTITYEEIEMLTLADIEAFEETLAAQEQEWVETTDKVTDGVAAAAAALEAAKAGDADAIASALSDANKAFNAANKARETAGWAEGGIADTYIKENIGAVVDEIQALADAAAPAEPEPVEEEAPAENNNKPAAPSSSNSSSSGSSTGIVIGVIVAVVVVVAAVVGIVLGKKKK